ncbi:hypothetical protein ACP8HZ_04210 [Francisella noatunensis]
MIIIFFVISLQRLKIILFTSKRSFTKTRTITSWLTTAKKLCAEQKECNFISGQRLVINLDDKKEAKNLHYDLHENHNSQF